MIKFGFANSTVGKHYSKRHVTSYDTVNVVALCIHFHLRADGCVLHIAVML